MFKKVQERFRKVELEARWLYVKLEYLQICGGKGLRVSQKDSVLKNQEISVKVLSN